MKNPLTPAQYARGFAACMARAAKRNEIGIEWFKSQIGFVPHKSATQVLRFLDVGAGTGSFTRVACSALLNAKKCRQIHCVTLEPNPHHFETLGLELQSDSRVQFSHRNQTWEDFHAGGDQGFDLILARNVLYYPEYWEEVAQQMTHSLQGSSGLGLVYHNTQIGFNQILRWSKNWQPDEPPGICLSLEDIVEGLEDMKIPHVHEVLPAQIDVSVCLDSQSEEGLDFLSFMVDEDLRAAGPVRTRDARDFLRHLARWSRRDKTWQLLHPLGALRFWAAPAI